MIRKFEEKDAEKASKIMLECIDKSLHYEDKNKEFMVAMSQPDKIIEKSLKLDFFVNEKDGTVIGTGAFDKGEIRTMFILPEMQGKGLGKEMLFFLVNYAKEKGFQKVFLNSSEEAEDFYQRQGFKKIRDDYEFDFHTIHMEKLI